MVRRFAAVLACVLALGIVGEAQLRTRVRVFFPAPGGGGGGATAFVLAVIPDTQVYAENADTRANQQTQFVADQKTAMNIAFVAHEGDVVENLNSVTEYTFMDAAWDIIDAASIPAGVTSGNHDNTHNSASIFHNYFGATRYGAQPWWCGQKNYLATSRPVATCQLFTAGGQNFVHIALGYMTNMSEMAGETTIEDEGGEAGWNTINKPTLRWVRDKLIEYNTRQAIITTHEFLLADGTFAPGAQEIYTLMVAPALNVFLVLNGHEITGTGCASGKCEAKRTETGAGRDVHMVLANYQNAANHGDGWLRMMTFDPNTRLITVKTYSPSRAFIACTINSVALSAGQCETDSNSQFTLTWPVYP